uniref:Uncharacterized protein n=1 Tax=Oryza meridionalis TaxID=40149 RepID=A0A0E0CPY1_9ORYZ
MHEGQGLPYTHVPTPIHPGNVRASLRLTAPPCHLGESTPHHQRCQAAARPAIRKPFAPRAGGVRASNRQPKAPCCRAVPRPRTAPRNNFTAPRPRASVTSRQGINGLRAGV